jgi:hypothetical protein
MAKIGSIDKRIADSVLLIAKGRVYLHTPKKEASGRAILNKGIYKAESAFGDAVKSKDAAVMIRVELVFVNQELQYSDNSFTGGSLEAAKTNLTDALNSHKVLFSTKSYPDADKTHSTGRAYRYKTLPKDAFHIACNSHITRLSNTLRSTELSPNMRALYKARIENMQAAKEIYIEKQREILGIPAPKSKGKDRGMEI